MPLGFGFGIRAVVAIAPSDGQYKPAGKPAPLSGVSYLLLQGGHDGDVSIFLGERLYRRLKQDLEASIAGDPPNVEIYREEYERDLRSYAAVSSKRELVADQGVVFVINGGGSAKEALERDASDLPNIRFAPYQPKERLAEVLATGDVHVVPLKRGLAASSVPSKTYSILAAGRPLLASIDTGTEVARLVERAGCGAAVEPDDPQAFLAGLKQLLASPDRGLALGQRGREFVERWVSPRAVAEAYEGLIEELRGEAMPPPGTQPVASILRG